MITQFKEVGSRKLLKKLFLTGHIPTAKDQVTINGKNYFVTTVVFNADDQTWTIWLHKFK